MFPLKSLTRWWELGLNFADRSLDAYLPTNRGGTRKGKTLQHQAHLSCAAHFDSFAFPGLLHRRTKGHSTVFVGGKFRTNEHFSQDAALTC